MLTLERPPTSTTITTGAITTGAGLVAHPVSAADGDDLRAMFERMSPDARRRRFFQAMPRVPASVIRFLSDVDQRTHLAWLVRAGDGHGPVVGEVRAVVDRHDPTRAEIALAVEDGWTGRGIGRTMLRLIGDAAASVGVRTVTAEVLPDNRRSIDLLVGAGLDFAFRDGNLVGSAPLPLKV